MATPNDSALEGPSGAIFSLLDTDLYKLTMQCAILKYFPEVGEYAQRAGYALFQLPVLADPVLEVAYSFTNRTPHMKLTRAAFRWLEAQIRSMWSMGFTLGSH